MIVITTSIAVVTVIVVQVVVVKATVTVTVQCSVVQCHDDMHHAMMLLILMPWHHRAYNWKHITASFVVVDAFVCSNCL